MKKAYPRYEQAPFQKKINIKGPSEDSRGLDYSFPINSILKVYFYSKLCMNLTNIQDFINDYLSEKIEIFSCLQG